MELVQAAASVVVGSEEQEQTVVGDHARLPVLLLKGESVYLWHWALMGYKRRYEL